ncbi:riboflavin synthase subunit alpha [Thalassotalea sp. M1531]|uniref:Riboflavin synthase n=1 Tax=Thalassotalea algicola TaxID=2716224 RepID=A0A7Y0LE03_9GAMM|nr:riboflavin synthase subunit alpha [Thalassotalea algicola]NMP32444.1 riboflavin synthase subunit alpha [Thalassotalea algicola]
MFTGIVQCKAKVNHVQTTNGICRLIIEVQNQYAQAIELGVSIAINGVCLTVVKQVVSDMKNQLIYFDIIDETLRVTNLSSINTNDYVNFERSLKVGDEIGGHQVSGHIHAKACVNEVTHNEDNCAITFELISGEGKYIFEKGFITINGVSLTVGQVKANQFSVHLIPETLARTNIGEIGKESVVNIEFDQQTITIVNTLERMKLTLN